MVLAMLIGIGLPSQEVKAAGGVSASWGMSGGSQAFYISNGSSETVWCDVYVVGGSRYGSEQQVAPGGSTTITADKSLYLELIVTGDVSGNEYAYVVSSGEHNYTVSYNLGGRSEVVETGVIQQGDSFEFVADSFYVDANGNEWQLAASENASRTVAYGTENYSFNYVAYDPGPVSASVAFVDEYGNVLKRQSKSIAYNQGKGQVTFDLPGELEVNGRKYEIDDTLTGSLTISYMDDVLDYEISYRCVSQQEEGPYTVTVEYWEVDAAGKPVTFLGNTYFMSSDTFW